MLRACGTKPFKLTLICVRQFLPNRFADPMHCRGCGCCRCSYVVIADNGLRDRLQSIRRWCRWWFENWKFVIFLGWKRKILSIGSASFPLRAKHVNWCCCRRCPNGRANMINYRMCDRIACHVGQRVLFHSNAVQALPTKRKNTQNASQSIRFEESRRSCWNGNRRSWSWSVCVCEWIVRWLIDMNFYLTCDHSICSMKLSPSSHRWWKACARPEQTFEKRINVGKGIAYINLHIIILRNRSERSVRHLRLHYTRHTEEQHIDARLHSTHTHTLIPDVALADLLVCCFVVPFLSFLLSL